MSDDCVYKVLLLGDSTVGKTCFLLKYTDKIFKEVHMTTVGLDYRLKTMTLKNGKNVKLQIWDTAGQDRFRSITKNYYKGAHGIIVVYDITSFASFDNVKNWISQIREEVTSNVVIYIAGNKIDLEEERKVQTEEGKKLAEEYGFPFVETSAKDGTNINEAFEDLVERIDSIFGKLGTSNAEIVSKNQLYKAKEKSGCC